MQYDYETYILKNGLKVLLMPSTDVNSATISAWVKSGSSQELEEYQGITHFVEHVALTATESWPTKEKLNEKTEFAGAKSNGGTGREFVNYYINVPYREVDFGIQFIYEVLYKCTLDPDYIEQERKIILDELSKKEDSLQYQNGQFIYNTLYQYKSGYNRNIIGSHETVSSFTHKQLRDYYFLTHSPNKVLITVVGNFEPTKAKKQIKELFEPQEKVENQVPYPHEYINEGVIDSKDSDKTELVLTSLIGPSVSAPELSAKDEEYINLWLSVLGGPMSSRLKSRLREKENLLYSIGTDVINFETFGFSEVFYAIPPEYFEKTLSITLEELSKFIEKGPTQKEIKHFKEYVTNRKLINYDNVYAYSSFIREKIFWNLPLIELDEAIDLVRNATKEDLHNSIKQSLNMDDLNLLAFGNTSDETKSIMESALKKYK